MRADLAWASWAALAEENTWRLAGHPAVVDGDVMLTYDELGHIAAEIADGLIARGIQPRDRIALLMPNCWQWEAAFLGCLMAGCVAVPINTRLRGREIGYLLTDSQCAGLMVAENFLAVDYMALLSDAEVPLPPWYVKVSLGRNPGPSFAALRQAGGGPAAGARFERIANLASGDACILMHTSGTSGLPKGVLITNGRALRIYSQMGEFLGLSTEDRFMVIPPFSHTYGLCLGLLASHIFGCCTLPVAAFDPLAVMATIDQAKVTVMPGPPTLFTALLDHPLRSNYDLRSLRAATTGASNISPDLVLRIKGELGIDRLLTAYGLTESTGVISCSLPTDDLAHLSGTSGPPIPHIEVRIADPNSGLPVDSSQTGEIQARGYGIMDGYITGSDSDDAFTADGWLRTGDLGRLTSDGYVQILDRIKDIVIVGGFNVAPAEVESVLLEHSSVFEAAAIGVSEPRLGQVLRAYVVIRPHVSRPSEEELISHCAASLAKFKVPRSIRFVDSLPRNSLGKVQKVELRQSATQERQ
jgi:acyl-CoA synthetase (AMP-forming)/AMP-acid ligase II